jgi:hypothetical protein
MFAAAEQDGRDVRTAVADYCHDVTSRAGTTNGSAANGNGHHAHSNGAAAAWDGGADELDTQVRG